MPRSSGVHRILVGALIGVAITLGPVAAWAFTATLSIPGLCANPIQVGGFSLETINPVDTSGPGGTIPGPGTPTIKPLVLTKAIDDCTPLLFRALFLGQRAPTATLEVGTNKTPVLFTIQLRAVLVTDLKHDFSAMGRGAGDDVLAEQVTLVGVSLSLTSGDTTVECDPTRLTCQ
jgi:type VI protein secretion system component Hcp